MLGIKGAKERRIALALGALLLVVVGAWLMYETRGTTLWFDEWIWALEYRDNRLGDLIRPHNGHPTLVPVLIYGLLFATVGIDGSAAYRAVGIAGHLLVVAVLFAYERAGSGTAPTVDGVTGGVEGADSGTAPTVDAVTGGEVTERDGCIEFVPPAGPAEPVPALDLTVLDGGLVISGAATVAVRRFADGFPQDPIGRVAPGGSGLLAIRADRASQPWHARVTPEARTTACGR